MNIILAASDWLGSNRGSDNSFVIVPIEQINRNKQMVDIIDLDRAQGLGLPYYDVLEIINIVFALAIMFTGLASIYVIARGGIKLITAGDDANAHKGAVVTIRNAIMGMLIAMVSFTIVYYFGKFMGYDLTSYISLDKAIKIVNNWAVMIRQSSLR